MPDYTCGYMTITPWTIIPGQSHHPRTITAPDNNPRAYCYIVVDTL